MKKYKSLASMVTAALLSVSLVGGASASTTDWTTYQGNNQHTGIIQGAAPVAPIINAKIELDQRGGAINTAPIMQSLEGGETLGYVLHNGGPVSGNNGGARLTKVSANNSKQIWSRQLTLTPGFQLSTPLLVQGDDDASEADDTIYVGTTGYGQVLNNDELVGKDVQHWSVNGGTADGEAIVLTGAQDTTLTQTNVVLNETATNRAAIGIWVGNTPNPGVEINVTVKVNGNPKVTKSFPATTTAIEDKSNKGNYYYYVNENFAATAGNNVTFEVDVVSGNRDKVKVEYASLYQQTGSIQKVTNLHQSSPSSVTVVSGITGQINTPITTDGTYLYFGTWTGGSTAGKYYQVKISDQSYKTYTPTSHGFYWAGATVVGDYVYFGSDNGKLHYQSVADFGETGGVISLPAQDGIAAGNIRSSITEHDGTLYFTSQGGFVWGYALGSKGIPTLEFVEKLKGTSTSTPTITTNDKLYVGYYAGFTNGGVQVYDFEAEKLKDVVKEIGPVQSSIIVKTNNNTDQLYFTTNSNVGAGYGYSYTGTTATPLWDTKTVGGNTYSLQGMAASGGYLMFGNDFNNLYIVK